MAHALLDDERCLRAGELVRSEVGEGEHCVHEDRSALVTDQGAEALDRPRGGARRQRQVHVRPTEDLAQRPDGRSELLLGLVGTQDLA